MDFDHRSYTGNSNSNPVQILNQDGTLAEQISFVPGDGAKGFGFGGGSRVRARSLGF